MPNDPVDFSTAMPWLTSLVAGGAGAAVGGPSTTKENYNKTTSQQKSDYWQRILLPEQQDAISSFSPFLRQLLTDPSAGLAPLRTAAVGRVNNSFVGAPQMIRNKYSTGGGNKSGRAGRVAIDTEMGRLGQVAGVNAQYDQLASDRQMQGGSLAQQFLSQNFGQSGASYLNGNEYGSSQKTVTQPGGGIGQGIGAALASLAKLMTVGL